jgi:phosphoribosylaminoimidazolecarboxamide formyltransferase/IMP cyclohydrolase
MIRAAAKNHAFSAVVVHPESYDAVLDELREAEGLLSMATREALASEAFAYTARYDIAISRWFAEKGEDFPPLHVRAFEKVVDLPYGENPHQRAAFFGAGGRGRTCSAGAAAAASGRLQQHPGPRCGARRRDFDAPPVDRQAQQPMRPRPGRGRRGLPPAVASDPLSAYGGVVVSTVDRRRPA